MLFHKKNRMEIDMYILCLHKFEDDRVILDDNELKNANKAIGECLDYRGYLKKKEADEELREKERWYVYTLCPLSLLDKRLPPGVYSKLYDEVYSNITEAKLGYYHHRTIVRFRLEYPKCDFSILREIRKELKKKADELIEECVRDRIYNLVLSGKMKEEGTIRFLYTYPFIVVKEKKGRIRTFCTYLKAHLRIRGRKKRETIPFSQEIGTLSFDILEIGRFKLTSKRSVMRVSGPSIVLFTKGKVDPKLLRDIINATYQHCLYEKKLKDEEKGVFENILDESILVKLWTHIIDTMGGEYTDVFLSRITSISLSH